MGNIHEEEVLLKCENALQNDKKYIKIQKEMIDAYRNNDIEKYSELSIDMQIVVQKICYYLGETHI